MKVLSRIVNMSRLPIFRSEAQVRILVVLFVMGGDPATLTEIAGRAVVSKGLTHKEFESLGAAGLVFSHRRGSARFVAVNESSPLVADLRSLLTKAFGPVPAIEEALAEIPGIDEAFAFGSFVSPAPGSPTDVDVMMIGEPDLGAVYDALRQVEDVIGFPVNVVVRTSSEWQADESGFAQSVKQSDKIPLEVG